MIDLEYQWIEIDCPNCRYGISIMLQAVKLQEICYCHNCKKRIQLVDNDASTHTSINKIDLELKKLDKALKKLFK